MTASAKDVARNLFHWANGNADRIAQIRAAFDASIVGTLTRGGLDTITNATKNGINLSRLQGMNESDRITALRMAVEWLDAGFIVTQSRSLGRF